MTTHLVILAGGRGERLRPWTSDALPKPCLRPDGERSLLQRTLDRFAGSVDGVHVVAGAALGDALLAAAPSLRVGQLVVEPSARGTGAAVVLGLRAARDSGGSRVIVVPADHMIDDDADFAAAAHLACSTEGAVGLVGVTCDVSRLGLGWVLPGSSDGRPGLPVLRFVEKPARTQRDALVGAGALANTGVFAGSLGAFAASLQQAPGLAALLTCGPEELLSVWRGAPEGAFDRLVLERGAASRVVPYAGGWSDVGTWRAMAEVLPEVPLGRGLIRGGRASAGADHIVVAPRREVVITGLPDLLVVDDGRTLHIQPRPCTSEPEDA